MRTINQIIGENLRKIRELSGFTQEQIAKSIGIERSAYSNYEGGTREVPYDILERISNMFGCEPFILFEDNIQADNEIMATAFRISDLEDNDLKEKKQKKEKDCHTGKPPCFLPVRSRKKMKRSSGLQNRSKKISMETEL